MTLFPLVVLSLAASAQASPLWGLHRRQGAGFCDNPEITTAASLVLTGTGDALYTYTPSRVSDTAQWSIQTPITITDADSTSTIYPFGYVWALSGTPGTLQPPALPTTDVLYPLPNGASATLCNSVPANATTTRVFRPGSTIASTSTSVEIVDTPSTPIATATGTGNPTGSSSTSLGTPTTQSTLIDTTPIPNTNTDSSNSTPPNNPGSSTVTDTTASTQTTGTSVGTTTDSETAGTPPTGTSTTSTGVAGTETSSTVTTNTETNDTPTNTPTTGSDTTGSDTTGTETTITGTTGTDTTTDTTGTDTTTTDTTGTDTTTTDTTGADTTTTDTATYTTTTDATTADTITTDTTATHTTTTGTTTGSSAEGTTTEGSNGSATSEQPDPNATSFPTYDPPTATVTGAAATSEAIKIGPILWSLWNNRDMIKSDDDDEKSKYIEEVEKTKDDIVTLWSDFDVKPEIPTECGETALKKRSLISGIIGLLDTAAKLIGCAEKVVDNLVDQIKLPDPPIDIIDTLTDTLKDISDELEKEDEKPTETEDVSTTEKPTSTESCTATGVESCSETVYLSTSFYKDGDVDTSTVETITTETCTTITACDSQATTIVTTITSVTSETGGIVCDYDCTACVGSSQKRAEPTSRPVVGRSLEERKLDNIPLLWGTSNGDRSNYIMEVINDWEGDKAQLDWVFANFDLVSDHGAFGDADIRRWVVGLVGCTGIAIVSKTGWWLAHFMEPGFISANQYDIQRWDNRIIGSMDNGNAKYTKPDTLMANGDILSLDNGPIIYLSTPIDASGERLYNDKVNIIMDKLTGDGAPFNGIEVKELRYKKPDSEVQQGLWQNSANGKILIEYTPDQIDEDDNFEEVIPDPREKMTRVWQEFAYYERRIPIYGQPQCNPPTDDASGADPSNVKQLAQLFCEGKGVDFSADAELTLGGSDLDPAVSLDADFKFTFTKRDDGDCELSCTDIYDSLIGSCQYNSHLFTGEAHITYECGKYGLEAIANEDDSGGDSGGGPDQPEVRDNCADTTIYTKFTLDQATQAIDDFCGHDISLPNAAQPVKKTYQYDDVVLQLWTQWSSKGQDGCNNPDNGDASLSHDVCKERFLGAVNDCNTDTTTDKYGNYPYIWNSPNGCIDFWIYGDGADFSCDDILGTVPIPCQTSGITLD